MLRGVVLPPFVGYWRLQKMVHKSSEEKIHQDSSKCVFRLPSYGFLAWYELQKTNQQNIKSRTAYENTRNKLCLFDAFYIRFVYRLLIVMNWNRFATRVFSSQFSQKPCTGMVLAFVILAGTKDFPSLMCFPCRCASRFPSIRILPVRTEWTIML